MTYPPPGYPPGYPPPGYPPPKPVRLRGRVLLILGTIFTPIGVLGLVFGLLVLGARNSSIDDLQRVPIASGSGSVSFDETGGYVAYYEASSIDDQAIPPVDVTLVDSTGREISVDTPYGNRDDGRIDILTYDHGSDRGIALYEFTIDSTGSYEVRLGKSGFEEPGSKMAFGDSLAGSQIGGRMLVIIGLLALVAGLVLLIIGFVRRAGHKRRLAAAAAQPYPQPGYGPPGPPQPGYPPPPS